MGLPAEQSVEGLGLVHSVASGSAGKPFELLSRPAEDSSRGHAGTCPHSEPEVCLQTLATRALWRGEMGGLMIEVGSGGQCGYKLITYPCRLHS